MAEPLRIPSAAAIVALEAHLLQDELEKIAKLRASFPRERLIERRAAACVRLKTLRSQVELIEFKPAREWLDEQCTKMTLDLVTLRIGD